MKQSMKSWPGKSPCTKEKDRQTLHQQMTQAVAMERRPGTQVLQVPSEICSNNVSYSSPALAIVHLLFLHETGSNNPTGLNSD
ncbi:hypothetical protein P7M20_31265, partial [Vibrio parahaemolyticus]|nr:hypothetical protein [Vibrio parahaemolyticus]